MSLAAVPDAAADVFDRRILPILFHDVAPAPEPTLTLLSGIPGSGASRATGRLLAQGGAAAVVRATDLPALAGASSQDVQSAVVAGWLRSSIRHARESKRSLILDGPLRTPEVVTATVKAFSAAGFRTHIAFVGARHGDALLTLVSDHMLNLRRGVDHSAPAVDEVGAEMSAQRDVAASLEQAAGLDRVTVWSGAGTVALDGDPSAGGARAALEAAESARRTTAESVAWLSELRRITTISEEFRSRDARLTRALIELHEIAVHDVIPGLQVAADSSRGAEVLTVQERATAARLILLRRSLPVEPRPWPDLAAPVIPMQGPSISGPSR